MPFWIEGWLEVMRMWPPEEDEHSWQGVLRIGPLVDCADDVSEELFGLSRRLVSSDEPHGAVAARRGIPPHPSAELRADLERIAQHERLHGPGELGGYTYATWSELSTFRATHPAVQSSDWAVVFDIAERIVREERFSGERLRLVVWYDW